MRKKKIEDYTREECISLALNYGKIETFRRKAYNAYAAAHIFGWWVDIKKLVGQRHSMTKKECHEIALRYLTPKEWERNDARTYGYAKNHGWIPDITTHMKRIVDYTPESCHEIALNYETRTEFARNDSGAWNYARTHGILDEVCSHMVIRGSKRKRIIYVFEFDDHHAYVGLTFNIKDRLSCHLANTKSAVYRYIHKTGCNYLFKTISEWLLEKDAQNEENKSPAGIITRNSLGMKTHLFIKQYTRMAGRRRSLHIWKNGRNAKSAIQMRKSVKSSENAETENN